LQAEQLTQQGQQYAAGLGKDIGLAGLTTGIEASAKQAATAAAQQTADLERLKAQAATGAEKQAYEQKIADLQYQTFMDQQNYQKQQLEYLSNILRGNAAALGFNSSTIYTTTFYCISNWRSRFSGPRFSESVRIKYEHFKITR
jgi:hypothetical protein